MTTLLPRIVITGLGVVSPAGVGMEALYQILRNGHSCMGPVDAFDAEGLPCRICAAVPDFRAADFIPIREARRLDRSSQLFVAACSMAAEQSGLFNRSVDRSRIGIFEGTSLGGLSNTLREYEAFLSKGICSAQPHLLSLAMNGAGGSLFSILRGIQGPVTAFSNGSVSSACAFASAFDQLRLNKIDAALVGGSEAPFSRAVFALFGRAGILSKRNDASESACRPFDATRDGTVLAEGAAAFVLERAEQALEREATIRGQLFAAAITSDAVHLAAPAQDAIQQARSIQLAISEAGIPPEEVDSIIAHGTATPLNDRTETKAIKRVFGEGAYRIPVSAVKSMIGHALGACTAVELAAALIAMEHQFAPPTINLHTLDPECDLDYVPNRARNLPIRTVLVKSTSFGGKNSALIVKKWEK